MEIKPKNQNYLEIQNSRSGGNMNSNTLIDDFNKVQIYIDPTWNILDIGCRQGETLRRLYELGCKHVYGIDIGEQAKQRWSEERYSFYKNLHQGDIHEGVPFKCSFDLITISHVLEHCYNPFQVLDVINENLKIGGYLHSIVPIEPKNSFKSYLPHLVRFDSHEEHIEFYTSEGYEKCHDRLDRKDNSVVILIKR